MRKLAMFVAATALIFGSVGHAETDTPDIYSKDGVTGPSFSRSTQCAAIWVLTAQMYGAAGDGYTSSIKQGTAWLLWAGRVAEGKDATAEMNRRKEAITARTAKLDNDAYNGEIAKEIKSCNVVRNMFGEIEPFASVFKDTVAQSGNSVESNTPDIMGAADCMTNFAVVAEIIGEDAENYSFYNEGSDHWYQYAISLKGQKEADRIIIERAKAMGDSYTALLKSDQDAGLKKIDDDSVRCVELSKTIPDYF